MDSRKATSDSVSLLDAMADSWTKPPKRHIQLVGDAGAGKSVLLQSTYCHLVKTKDEMVPIYFDLTKFHKDKDETIRNRLISDWCGDCGDMDQPTKTRKLNDVFSSAVPGERPAFIFFIDGLNEIEQAAAAQYLEEITLLLEGWNAVQVVLATRHSLWNLEKQFCTWDILPLREEVIDVALRKAGVQVPESIPAKLKELLHTPLFLLMYTKEWSWKPLNGKEEVISTAGEFFDAHYERLVAKALPDENQNQRTQFALKYLFPAMAGSLQREFDFEEFNIVFQHMQPYVRNRYNEAFDIENIYTDDPAGLIGVLVNNGVLIEIETRQRYRFRHIYHREYLIGRYYANEIEKAVKHPVVKQKNVALKTAVEDEDILAWQRILDPDPLNTEYSRIRKARDGYDPDVRNSVPRAFFERMPAATLHWIGEILHEHIVSEEDSVLAMFMCQCGGVALGNCLEILKISRNNTINRHFDGLDLSNARLFGVDLRGSSFRDAKVQLQNFLPVLYDEQSSQCSFDPLISPDGKYIVSQSAGMLQLFFLKDYLPFTVHDKIKCPHFTKDNTLVYCGAHGITSFSPDSNRPFQILYQQASDQIVDFCLCKNYLVIIEKDKLLLLNVDTQEIITSSSDHELTDNQYVALSESSPGKLNLALSSRFGPLRIAEIDIGSGNIIQDADGCIELPTRTPRFSEKSIAKFSISRIEAEGDYLLLSLIENTPDGKWNYFNNNHGDIYYLTFSERKMKVVYGSHDVCSKTVCLNPASGVISFFTIPKTDAKNSDYGYDKRRECYFKRYSILNGEEISSELTQSWYPPICSNDEICIVNYDDNGRVSVYSMLQRQILFDLFDSDYRFDNRNTDISASGNKVAVLFRSAFGYPFVFNAIKAFDLSNNSVSYTDLKQVEFFDAGIEFRAVGDESIYLSGRIGREHEDLLFKGPKHTLISMSGENWNGVWEESASSKYQDRMTLIDVLKPELQHLHAGNQDNIVPLTQWLGEKPLSKRFIITRNLVNELQSHLKIVAESISTSFLMKQIACAQVLAECENYILVMCAKCLLLYKDTPSKEKWFFLEGFFDESFVGLYFWAEDDYAVLLHPESKTLRIWNLSDQHEHTTVVLPEYDSRVFHYLWVSKTDGARFIINTRNRKSLTGCYLIYPETPFKPASVYPIHKCHCSDNNVAVYAHGKELTVFDYRNGHVVANITPLFGRVEKCPFQGAIMDDKLKDILRRNGAEVD